MKKIVLAVLVGLAMFAAQAAQVKWTALNVYGTDGATKNTTGVGYMFAASDMSAVTAALAGDDAAAAATTLSGLSVVSATAGSTGGFASSAVDYASGSATFFAVIFDAATIADATSYYMTTTKTVTVPGSGSASVAFGNQSSATFGKTDAYASAGWAGSSGGGTPEPTSGLLLLVGGALLALRRKQK